MDNDAGLLHRRSSVPVDLSYRGQFGSKLLFNIMLLLFGSVGAQERTVGMHIEGLITFVKQGIE
jgi:hypothetical protein